MTTSDTLGINCVEAILFDAGTLAKVFGDIAAFGFKHVRCEIPWGLVEPAKGQLNWAPVQRLKAAAAANGLTILPVLGVHNPAWNWTHADFAFYVGQLAELLPLPAYELGNEPNLHSFNAWAAVGTPAALLAVGAKAIRDRLPDARILSPGLASSISFTLFLFPGLWFIPPQFPVYTNKSPEDFLRETLQKPGGSSFDTVAYHPYAIDSGFVCVTPDKSPFMQARTDAIRGVLKAAGKPTAALWLTEWGFDSAKVSAADVLARFEAQWKMTPAMQGPGGRSYLFCWRDYPGHGGKYGLVNANNVPRQPLYDRVKALLKT